MPGLAGWNPLAGMGAARCRKLGPEARAARGAEVFRAKTWAKHRAMRARAAKDIDAMYAFRVGLRLGGTVQGGR